MICTGRGTRLLAERNRLNQERKWVIAKSDTPSTARTFDYGQRWVVRLAKRMDGERRIPC